MLQTVAKIDNELKTQRLKIVLYWEDEDPETPLITNGAITMSWRGMLSKLDEQRVKQNIPNVEDRMTLISTIQKELAQLLYDISGDKQVTTHGGTRMV